jgi:uncharacterized protein (TIRG00374 family)
LMAGRRGLLVTILGAAIFVVYLAYSNPFTVLFEVGRFNAVDYLVAVAVDYVGLFLYAASWYVLLRALDVKVSVWEATQVTYASLFITWILPLPMITEVLKAQLIRDKKNSNIGKAISSSFIHKAYYNIAFGVIIGLSAVMVTVFGGGGIPIHPALIWFEITWAAISSLIFGLILSPRLLRRVYGLSPAWVRRNVFDRIYGSGSAEGSFERVVDDIESSIRELRMKIGSNILSFILVALHWGSGSVTAFIVARSLGVHIDIWMIILVYAIVEFIQQLNFIMPGGLGVVDAGLTGGFVLIGLPLSVASAVSLLTRLATYWLELLLCAPITLHYGYMESVRLPRRGRDAPERASSWKDENS